MSAPILIFPAGMPRSLDYLARCLRDGQAVIGSSSLAYDISKDKYPKWAHLPYVNDSGFNAALLNLINESGIAAIFTPNPVVWSYLQKVLPELECNVKLANASPIDDEMRGYRTAGSHASNILSNPLELESAIMARTQPPELELATLFRHANVIPGMCDNEKIGALTEIARRAPQGDIVEIGSAWGKSAFVLARLARLHGIGKLLCVDPWKSEYLVQNDVGGLVDSCVDQYDYDETLRVFEMNLLPYHAGDINYLRLPSTSAEQHYATGTAVSTQSFGTTHYAGGISILHIDGNHHYDCVHADISAWNSHVVPGGWIIIDDYVWPYGDGPQRAGDAYQTLQGSGIACAFVMGTALFLQKT